MSRIAKAPVELPSGVEFSQSGNVVTMKGSKGSLTLELNSEVELTQEDNALLISPRSGSRFSTAIAGTMRSLLDNMAKGVSEGFERKLELVGVGYRAQAQGNKVNMTLGFSHPIVHEVPEGVTVETPTQTEILIRGADKQQVGQVAAELRGYRPPEPYKGKGIRYANERVVIKEAKKK
ncbi:MAG: 50S ribosomal protein L6 [Woeseiaceae bacterium]|nr:50S ribosomal protein L6 [Woeseiaceae bacterium]